METSTLTNPCFEPISPGRLHPLRFVGVVAATLTIALACLGSPSSASAARASWLQSTVNLSWPAQRGFGTVCTRRNVSLAAGLYDLRVFVQPVGVPQERRRWQRKVRLLRGGSYRWQACIDVHEFETWPGGLQYRKCTSLQEPGTGRLRRLCGFDLPFNVTRGSHYYGSRLQRIG
jgi:hypothetical protein